MFVIPFASTDFHSVFNTRQSQVKAQTTVRVAAVPLQCAAPGCPVRQKIPEHTVKRQQITQGTSLMYLCLHYSSHARKRERQHKCFVRMEWCLPCGLYFRGGANKRWNIEFTIRTLHLCNNASYIKKKIKRENTITNLSQKNGTCLLLITIIKFCHCFQKKSPQIFLLMTLKK